MFVTGSRFSLPKWLMVSSFSWGPGQVIGVDMGKRMCVIESRPGFYVHEGDFHAVCCFVGGVVQLMCTCVGRESRVCDGMTESGVECVFCGC